MFANMSCCGEKRKTFPLGQYANQAEKLNSKNQRGANKIFLNLFHIIENKMELIRNAWFK